MSWKDRAEPVTSGGDWRSRAEPAADFSDVQGGSSTVPADHKRSWLDKLKAGDLVTAKSFGDSPLGATAGESLEDIVHTARNYISGVTSGWSDKAAAAVEPGDYKKNLEDIRGSRAADREKNAPAAIGAETLGTLLSPVNKVTKGVGMVKGLPGVLARIATAGGQGALAGAGNAKAGEEAQGAKGGGILGSILGTGGELVRGVGTAVKGLSNAAAVRAATGASVPTILEEEASLPELAKTARDVGASSPFKTLLQRRALVQGNMKATGEALGRTIDEGDVALQALKDPTAYVPKPVIKDTLGEFGQALKENPLGEVGEKAGVVGDRSARNVIRQVADLFEDPNAARDSLSGSPATLKVLERAKQAADARAYTGASPLSAQGRKAGQLIRAGLKDQMMESAQRVPGLPEKLEGALKDSSKALALGDLLDTPSAYNNPLLKPLQVVDPLFGRLGTPAVEAAEKVTPNAGVLTRLGLTPGHAALSPEERADANDALRR